MNVTVYSLPSCQQCRLTKAALDRQGTPYRAVDLSEDTEAYEHVKSLGYQSAPVVEAGEEHWSGFKSDRIKALAA